MLEIKDSPERTFVTASNATPLNMTPIAKSRTISMTNKNPIYNSQLNGFLPPIQAAPLKAVQPLKSNSPTASDKK